MLPGADDLGPLVLFQFLHPSWEAGLGAATRAPMSVRTPGDSSRGRRGPSWLCCSGWVLGPLQVPCGACRVPFAVRVLVP